MAKNCGQPLGAERGPQPTASRKIEKQRSQSYNHRKWILSQKDLRPRWEPWPWLTLWLEPSGFCPLETMRNKFVLFWITKLVVICFIAVENSFPTSMAASSFSGYKENAFWSQLVAASLCFLTFPSANAHASLHFQLTYLECSPSRNKISNDIK